MDITDVKILEILQSDGRISMKDLGSSVALSPPAVSERVKKLEDSGIIIGYKAIVDPNKVGRTIQAIINVAMKVSSHKRFLELAKKETSIINCHHLTGEDCMTVHVIVSDTLELEGLLGRIQQVGDTKTTVILSSPIKDKPILP